MAKQQIKGYEWVQLTNGSNSNVTNIGALPVYIVISETEPTLKGGIGMTGYLLEPEATLPVNASGMTMWAMYLLKENYATLEYT